MLVICGLHGYVVMPVICSFQGYLVMLIVCGFQGYVVMSHFCLSGASLSRLIEVFRKEKKTRMPCKLLCKIMLEATSAVEHLIRNDIVHCDIKPPNFLYHRYSSVYFWSKVTVTDFTPMT